MKVHEGRDKHAAFTYVIILISNNVRYYCITVMPNLYLIACSTFCSAFLTHEMLDEVQTKNKKNLVILKCF